MADITFTIPDSKMARVINALCDRYGYVQSTEELNPETGEMVIIPNPQSRAEFAKSAIARIIVSTVKEAEMDAARRNAGIDEIPIR